MQLSIDPPLAVDLDGTLIRVDSLHESLVACISAEPAALHELGRSLLRGKATFKRNIASRVEFDPTLLPYNEELLSYLKVQKRAGRRIGLFTAADQSVAEKIAAYLGIFDVVRGSDGERNLDSTRKVAAITEAFGNRFVYAGNDVVDKSIFDAAERVILVGHTKRLRRLLGDGKVVESTFLVPRPTLATWSKALRLHHWAKNALVFVPAILGFPVVSLRIGAEAALLFLLMGLLASAAYILNDMLDLREDRQHPSKRLRPFASGSLSIRGGMLAAILLIVTALALGLLLPAAVLWILAVYLGLTLAYSLGLKRLPILDVVVLAGLFTLRVLAGSFLLPIPPSPWLLTFSMLFFLGLAMVKRYTELDQVVRSGGSGIASRGYTVRDLPLLLAAGIASGFGAIVIFMIYVINEHYPRDIYKYPGFLWAMMPLILIWTLRMWHLTVHERMDDDPLVFALSDWFSLILAAIAGVILFAAWS